MGGFPGELTKSTNVFGLKLFEVIGIAVAILLLLFLISLSLWLSHRKRARNMKMMKLPVHDSPPKQPSPLHQPKLQETTSKQPFLEPSSSGNISEDRITVEKEIVHIRHGSIEKQSSAEMVTTTAIPTSDVEKTVPIVSPTASEIGKTASEIGVVSLDVSGRVSNIRKSASDLGSRTALDTPKTASGIRETASDLSKKPPSEIKSESPSSATNTASTKETLERTSSFSVQSTSPPDAALEVSHLGWGHWYSLQALEAATKSFSDSSIVGKGGYGIVYHGILPNGSPIAVKKLVNNRGQVEREFKVEVEAIGRVRHKNLVSLLGYCMEGPHRLLVYEYIDNGNLDQWLHGSLGEKKSIPWDMRMKIIIGTAKGLAYLHEGLEPKVVHRDVKSSNILIDSQWNPKISDFGLAKLLGAENTHVTTRVMGTFGYVAPEYASTGLLNEKSDVYSFGVLLMEMITGRDPVDYNRPAGEVNLVDWLKMMVGSRRSDEVADPRLEVKPSLRSLKRALLVALRCVDPDALQRPKMSQVIHMLETDENPFREERRSSRDLLPRTRSNPHHLQTILQSQGISLDNPGGATVPTSGQRDNTYMRRVPSRDAFMSVGRGSPVRDTDPHADTSSSTSYDPIRSAKWRRF